MDALPLLPLKFNRNTQWIICCLWNMWTTRFWDVKWGQRNDWSKRHTSVIDKWITIGPGPCAGCTFYSIVFAFPINDIGFVINTRPIPFHGRATYMRRRNMVVSHSHCRLLAKSTNAMRCILYLFTLGWYVVINYVNCWPPLASDW